MKKLGNRIASIVRADPETFSVRLRYEDGSLIDASLASLFGKPKGLTAEILRGCHFDRCYVESGALAWPNGFELCPDALVRMGTRVRKHRRARKAA